LCRNSAALRSPSFSLMRIWWVSIVLTPYIQLTR
jgi:hypothetical protein